MQPSLTLNGITWQRIASFVAGLGMMAASALTIQHFFAANYPASIWAGSFCDISAFFNCDSSAFSVISQIVGVPIGYFGLIVGALVSLGAVFPSTAFERTNKSIALLNFLGVIALFFFSILYLKTLCPLCSIYYVFSALSFILFWKWGIDREDANLLLRYLRPSMKHVSTFAVVTLVGAYGVHLFHDAKQEAQSGGAAARVVEQYFSLPIVRTPSFISPYWSVRSTERFEDAPIQVIEYGDFLCSDCAYLTKQIHKLKEEFKGKINVAFQFFPLEAKCNAVVEKNLHPGACEASYIAAYDPTKFQQIHDEIFAAGRAARDPAWRQELARRYGVEAALTDAQTQEIVHRIIQTGAEYEQTSDKYAAGIRSTPTLILNNRMVIGTFPIEHLRAIFQALVDERAGKRRFLENWQPDK